MKKTKKQISIFLTIILMLIFTSTFLSADDTQFIQLPQKLHLKYNLDTSMTVQEVAETLNITTDRFKEFFQLNPRDARVDTSTILSHNIFIDDIYQLYCMDRYGFNDFSTIFDVSRILGIPYKKLAVYIHIDQQDVNNRTRTLRNLGLETLDLLAFEATFKHDTLNYISTVTVIGVTVVFLVLLLIASLVSRLVLLDKKVVTGKKVTNIANMNISAPKAASDNFINYEDAIVAIIAAVHRFKSEIANDHKILLTYSRINVSMWQASGKIETPNKQYNMMKNK